MFCWEQILCCKIKIKLQYFLLYGYSISFLYMLIYTQSIKEEVQQLEDNLSRSNSENEVSKSKIMNLTRSVGCSVSKKKVIS